AQYVDRGHEYGVDHGGQRGARKAEQAHGGGDPDITVEPDAALDHRSQHRAVETHEPGGGQQHQRAERGGSHQPRRDEPDGHARKIGLVEPVREQQRQQYEIGQPLGLRPEILIEKTEALEQVAEPDDERDRQQGGKDQGKHGRPFSGAVPLSNQAAGRRQALPVRSGFSPRGNTLLNAMNLEAVFSAPPGNFDRPILEARPGMSDDGGSSYPGDLQCVWRSPPSPLPRPSPRRLSLNPKSRRWSMPNG